MEADVDPGEDGSKPGVDLWVFSERGHPNSSNLEKHHYNSSIPKSAIIIFVKPKVGSLGINLACLLAL